MVNNLVTTECCFFHKSSVEQFMRTMKRNYLIERGILFMKEKEQLLQLRKEVAKRSGQATYLVPNDKEIEMLLKVRPKTLEQLTALKGFPMKGKRVAAYGQAVIDIFTKDVKEVQYTGSGDSIRATSTLKPSSVW